MGFIKIVEYLEMDFGRFWQGGFMTFKKHFCIKPFTFCYIFSILWGLFCCGDYFVGGLCIGVVLCGLFFWVISCGLFCDCHADFDKSAFNYNEYLSY
ncbi:hypothetical protein [Helicobacter sp. T3_23-1056]